MKRPEPWHVRAAHDDELRRLNKRFTHAVNSSWCGMFASRSGTASDDRASCFTSSASAPAAALEPRSLSRFQQIATRVAVGDALTDRSGRASARRRRAERKGILKYHGVSDRVAVSWLPALADRRLLRS